MSDHDIKPPTGEGGLKELLLDKPGKGVLLVTLNRPDARNALRNALLAELAAVLDCAAQDVSIGAIVITGSESIFAAGADLQELRAMGPIDLITDERPRLWRQVASFPKPLIAAVNGHALGAGSELAMHCDIVIAGLRASFGQPEILLGMIPGAGGTQRLARIVGKSRAMQMVLTGEAIDAFTALACGLVSEVVEVERTVARALELATTIASRPPIAVRLAKVAVLMAEESPLSAALEAERQSFCLLAASADRAEGIAAFLEKRIPIFRGA